MAQDNIPPTSLESSEETPFYQTWLRAVTKPSVETFETIIAQPNASATGAYIQLGLVMLLGATVSSLLRLIVQKLFGAGAGYSLPLGDYGSNLPALTGITSFICGIPLAVLFGLIGVTILVGIMHGLARMLGGTGDFDKLLYAVAAFYCPIYIVNSFLSPIPWLNCLLIPILIYMLVLNAMAVKANYQFDWGRAVAASLGVYVLIFILVFCCVVIFGALLAPVIGNTFSGILQQLGTPVP